MKSLPVPASLLLLAFGSVGATQQARAPVAAEAQRPMDAMQASMPTTLTPQPLYPGDILNAIAGPDAEQTQVTNGMTMVSKVSRPTLTAYLPSANRNSKTAILLFPSGGFVWLNMEHEAARTAMALQDHGIAAIVVKYRLPSDGTMRDKSIGPLQDAQQALRQVRLHAAEWNIDPAKVGVFGFSAGGHLASALGTHFGTAYVANPDNVNLRPDFMILAYPVITMTTPSSSRLALLGEHPDAEQLRQFSNELQVTGQTPATLLLAASDDVVVDVDHSILFYEALRHQHVSAQMVLFQQGGHGFRGMAREEWLQPVWRWLERNGWIKP